MSNLSISYSNVLTSLTPTITDTAAGEVADYISSPDHSLNYTSGSTATDFTVDYGAVNNISYVGISGHTAALTGAANIELYDDVTLLDSVTITRNHNIMFTFDERNFTALKVVFVTTPNTAVITVSFIAAGQYISILGGEESGYKRNWLNRQTVQRTSSNLQAAPVAITRRSKPLKGTLSLPNELASFTDDGWQTLIDFTELQPFFIRERDDLPESTYICYNAISDISAHSQTRTLNKLSLKFELFNGV